MARPRGSTSPSPACGLLAVVWLLAIGGCGPQDAPPPPPTQADPGPVGTPALRAALFDTILARTARRDAFSPVKNATLGYDPLLEMEALRDTVVQADTEEALFYALARLSHARRDRHLDVAVVPGGIRPRDLAGIDTWNGVEGGEVRQAPVRIFPDYGERGGFFVGDVADDTTATGGAAPGDRVVSVHGIPVEQYEEAVQPWHRHSSIIGLRWKIAEAMGQHTAILPPDLRGETLRLELERPDGTRATVDLPYLPPEAVSWRGVSEPTYPGYREVRSTPTWDLLLPEGEVGPEGAPAPEGVGGAGAQPGPASNPDSVEPIILIWYGFRETMLQDVDTLVALGDRAGLLDRPLIVDVTRSRGGSLGAYAVQRLQPRPFRTTFGNLRLSDVTEPFVESKRADFAARNINDGGVPETMDDGGWLMDWLETDVMEGLARGDAYTTDVPFKSAHAPKDSDGTLEPAPLGFRGPVAIISGPSGGSHLDQFNAIFVDNGLGPVVGMTAGGFSNTWEWEEVLTFPGTHRPVIGYMYDIGHTIRPNGEILEGNPAAVDEWIPLTAEGHADYYARMFEAARARLSGAQDPLSRGQAPLNGGQARPTGGQDR